MERAQGYYDSRSVFQQDLEECARLVDRTHQVSAELEKACSDLATAEHAFLAFCGEPGEDLTEEHWAKLVSVEACHMINDPKLMSDPKLMRTFRVSMIADKVTNLQRQRDAVQHERHCKECELEEARRLFEVQEARHRRCTINCSVRRAAPFYEKRKLHDATFTSQVAALETVERAIHEARHKLENVQRRIGGSPPTNTAHMPYESILEELIPGSEIFQEAGDDGFESCDSEDERK